MDFLGVEQSWESFRKKYNPSGSTAVDLKSKVHRQSWLKPLVGVAAMFVFCCGILSMHASSYNVWKEIARWTEDTFSFANPYQSNVEVFPSAAEADQYFINDYNSLQEALAHYNIEETLVPCWIPERFRLALIEVYEINEDVYMEAQYINQDTLLVISVHHIVTGRESTLFKDNTPVSTITINGIDHYIMSYGETNTATWMNGQNECVITGNISQDELKQMLQSIYK